MGKRLDRSKNIRTIFIKRKGQIMALTFMRPFFVPLVHSKKQLYYTTFDTINQSVPSDNTVIASHCTEIV